MNFLTLEREGALSRLCLPGMVIWGLMGGGRNDRRAAPPKVLNDIPSAAQFKKKDNSLSAL